MKLKAIILGALLISPTPSQSKDNYLSAMAQSFVIGFSMGLATEKFLTNTSTPKEFLRIRDFVFELGAARLAVNLQADDSEPEQQVILAALSIFGYALGTIVIEITNKAS